MTEPIKTFRFTASAVIDLDASGGDGATRKRPRFHIEAYSGSPMQVSAFGDPVILDLRGLKAARKQIPILFDNNAASVVGQTDSIQIKDGVKLAGFFTSSSGDAGTILEHAYNGFEWQASIGASIVRSEYLKAGAKAKVNGREVVGPMLIARESRLHETSFVSIGADTQASATVAAKQESDMPAPTTPQTDQQTPDEMTLERNRVRDIIKACGPDYLSIQEQAINGGWTIEATKAAVLDALRKSRAHAPAPGGYGQPPMKRKTLEASLLLRAGHEAQAVQHYGEALVASARRLGPLSLVDVAAHALRMEGRDMHGMSRSLIASAGFSTLSLPTIWATPST